MSIGFQARAELVLSDGSGFLYAYSCCNQNLITDWSDALEVMDGEIWLSGDSLIEPEIHEKVRRLPSGRKKLIIKRIPRWPPIRELIANGKITVRNASGTWETEDFVDVMAIRILNNIFLEYQKTDIVPERISVLV